MALYMVVVSAPGDLQTQRVLARLRMTAGKFESILARQIIRGGVGQEVGGGVACGEGKTGRCLGGGEKRGRGVSEHDGTASGQGGGGGGQWSSGAAQKKILARPGMTAEKFESILARQVGDRGVEVGGGGWSSVEGGVEFVCERGRGRGGSHCFVCGGGQCN